MAFHRWSSLALLVVLSTSCAPVVKVSSAEGATASTRLLRLNSLVFERPAAFALRDFGNGVGLSFCGERDVPSCGSLSVLLVNELRPEQCRDRDAVAAWLRLPAGGVDQLAPVSVAGREGWLRDGKDVPMPTVVLCVPEGAWKATAVATGPKGEAPARGAFRLFLETARFAPAEQGPAAR